MQLLQFHFLLHHRFYEPEEFYRLEQNGLVGGLALWREKDEFLIRHRQEDLVLLKFVKGNGHFWYVDTVTILNTSLLTPELLKGNLLLLDEFYKQVVAACLRECFPLRAKSEWTEAPHDDALFLHCHQPIYLLDESFRKLDSLNPSSYTFAKWKSLIAHEYRSYGLLKIQHQISNAPCSGKYSGLCFIQSLEAIIQAILGSNHGFFSEALGIDDDEQYAEKEDFMKLCLEGKDYSVLWRALNKLDLSPYRIDTFYDWFLLLVKLELLIIYRKDFAAAAQILRYHTVFDGYEQAYVQLLLQNIFKEVSDGNDLEPFKEKFLTIFSNMPLIYLQLGVLAKHNGSRAKALHYFKASNFHLEKVMNEIPGFSEINIWRKVLTLEFINDYEKMNFSNLAVHYKMQYMFLYQIKDEKEVMHYHEKAKRPDYWEVELANCYQSWSSLSWI